MNVKVQKIAAHGLVKRNDKYLITRRSLVNDYKPGEWDVPGGTIEFGEDPIKALKREIVEESGLKVEIKGPLYLYSYMSNPKRHQFQIVYECKYLKGDVKLNPREHDKYLWATSSEIAKLSKIAFLKGLYNDYLHKNRG